MDRSRVDEVLEGWGMVAHSAVRPATAPRPHMTRSALPVGMLAAAAVVVVLAVALSSRGIGQGPQASLPAAGRSTPSTSPTATPTPPPSLAVSCEVPPNAPRTRLTCAAAIAAALNLLGAGRGAVQGVEFHYGVYCAAESGCGFLECATGGYVILTAALPTADQWVTVKADAQGTIVSAKLLGPWPPPGGPGLDWATCR